MLVILLYSPSPPTPVYVIALTAEQYQLPPVSAHPVFAVAVVASSAAAPYRNRIVKGRYCLKGVSGCVSEGVCV